MHADEPVLDFCFGYEKSFSCAFLLGAFPVLRFSRFFPFCTNKPSPSITHHVVIFCRFWVFFFRPGNRLFWVEEVAILQTVSLPAVLSKSSLEIHTVWTMCLNDQSVETLPQNLARSHVSFDELQNK